MSSAFFLKISTGTRTHIFILSDDHYDAFVLTSGVSAPFLLLITTTLLPYGQFASSKRVRNKKHLNYSENSSLAQTNPH